MRYNTKAPFLLFFLVLSMFSFALAVPPVTEVQNFPEGYNIQVHPIKLYFQEGQDVNFHIHVFNSSNGYPINESVQCALHLYAANGSHLFTGVTNTIDDMYDYEINVLGGNFTEQVRSYHVFCYNGGIAGDSAKAIKVTPAGTNIDMPTLISYILLLFSIIFIMLFISNQRSNTDFKSKESGIISNHKSTGQTLVKGILLGLFKNSFIWIYFLGWLLVLTIREILYEFSNVTIYSYFSLMANVYSLGLLLVSVYMIGYTIDYMRNIFSILTDQNWGISR